MRTRLVKRHYCDHCGKGYFHLPAIKRHELGCTKNPNRVCRMCLLAGFDQVNIATLIASQNGAAFKAQLGIEGGSKEKELRELCNNCPACILATIRQHPEYFPINFDWKGESKDFLDEHRPPSDHGAY